MKCPHCSDGKIGGIACGGPGGCRPILVECGTCNGRGEVPDIMGDWIERGRIVRARRMDRGETLRSCAARLGVGAALLSDIEMGRVDPNDYPEVKP